MTDSIKKKCGTFCLNKGEPIHRWYSYVEGYSSCLIVEELKNILSINADIRAIYDPFCGTGTTALVASCKGIDSFYSESNPFMQKVIETKINGVRTFKENSLIDKLEKYLDLISNCKIQEYADWNGFEKFFDPKQLCELLTIKSIISDESNQVLRDVLFVALSSIIVKVSKMTRRGDLRYAKEKEYKSENVIKCFVDKLKEIIFDIRNYGQTLQCNTVKVSEDARDNNYIDTFDCAITSPPYLNGTNYIRNTKLELKLNDFILHEKELPIFHSKGIVAGINNVSKRTSVTRILPMVEPYVEMLKAVSYDTRIPKMVAGYFSDMDGYS